MGRASLSHSRADPPMSLIPSASCMSKRQIGATIQSLARRSEMRQMMVRYKVKPEQAARNEELVRQVYEELHQTAPAGLRYATFVLEDGVSFAHVASIETADGRNPLTDVAAFRAFQEGID